MAGQDFREVILVDLAESIGPPPRDGGQRLRNQRLVVQLPADGDEREQLISGCLGHRGRAGHVPSRKRPPLKAHLSSPGRNKRVVLIVARQARERARIDEGLQGRQTRVELLDRYQAQRIVEALAPG